MLKCAGLADSTVRHQPMSKATNEKGQWSMRDRVFNESRNVNVSIKTRIPDISCTGVGKE